MIRREPATQHSSATPSPVAHCLLGALFLAAVMLLSLPQARAVSADFGWVPFWLLALPASAWLALQAQRLLTPGARTPASAAARRRSLAPASRRRVVSGVRGTRRANAA
jgi:hypothetical protein